MGTASSAKCSLGTPSSTNLSPVTTSAAENPICNRRSYTVHFYGIVSIQRIIQCSYIHSCNKIEIGPYFSYRLNYSCL